ncbi:beta barrel domain-containing protein [Streptomyces sp. NPDC054838]
MATSLEGVKPGDELLLVQRYDKGREPGAVTVHKVGRTLVHIVRYQGRPENGTDAYRIEDGRKNDGFGHSYLIRREEYEEGQRLGRLRDALRQRGVRFEGDAPGPEVLQALLDALDGKTYTKGYSAGYEVARAHQLDGMYDD